MFLGTHTPRLDEKGRLILPAKFRDELSDGLVITRGQDRCLAIWPMAAFVEQTQALRNAPSSNKQVRDYQRMLASGASDEVPDKQGRITIPPHLRSYAALDKECVVVGAINRVEVWDAEAWQAYSVRQESAFAEMNDEVFPRTMTHSLALLHFAVRLAPRGFNPQIRLPGTPSPVPGSRLMVSG